MPTVPRRRRAARFSVLTVPVLLAALLVAGPASATVASSTSAGWRPLAAGAAPASNPLKGFIPYAGDYQAFPYAMEWFYLPVNAVMIVLAVMT